MTRREVESVEDRIREHLRRDDLDSAVELLRALSPGDALELLDRSEPVSYTHLTLPTILLV